MLPDSLSSVTSVALACDFCDDFEFRRRFRAESGMSPRAYRRLFQSMDYERSDSAI
jgi:transcriptional regulator GlxA family with amidase domain